jgi:small multidrug resistance family-3 protein
MSTPRASTVVMAKAKNGQQSCSRCHGKPSTRLEGQGVSAKSYGRPMATVRSIALFVVAAFAEIGGAWLVWQGIREQRGLAWIGAGFVALGFYGLVATGQPSSEFGRVLAAYGGVFVVGSLGWGVIVDRFRPDRYDLVGAAICLIGVAVIMYGPRSA